MDGKGGYNDSLFIERLWSTVKYEELYLKAYRDGREARHSLGQYSHFYNNERPHKALGCKTPAEVFVSTPMKDTSSGMVESLIPYHSGTAGLHLYTAPTLSSQWGPPQSISTTFDVSSTSHAFRRLLQYLENELSRTQVNRKATLLESVQRQMMSVKTWVKDGSPIAFYRWDDEQQSRDRAL